MQPNIQFALISNLLIEQRTREPSGSPIIKRITVRGCCEVRHFSSSSLNEVAGAVVVSLPSLPPRSERYILTSCRATSGVVITRLPLAEAVTPYNVYYGLIVVGLVCLINIDFQNSTRSYDVAFTIHK